MFSADSSSALEEPGNRKEKEERKGFYCDGTFRQNQMFDVNSKVQGPNIALSYKH